MSPGLTIDGDRVTEVTIDGERVNELTIDGEIVPIRQYIANWDNYALGTRAQDITGFHEDFTGQWDISNNHRRDTDHSLRADNGQNSYDVDPLFWTNSPPGENPGPNKRFFQYFKEVGSVNKYEFWFCTSGGGQPGGRFSLEWFEDGDAQLRCFVSGSESWDRNFGTFSHQVGTWCYWMVDWLNPSRAHDMYCELGSVSSGKITSLTVDQADVPNWHTQPAYGGNAYLDADNVYIASPYVDRWY